MLRQMILALILLATPALRADETPTPSNLDRLIQQLDGDEFAERQAASDELSKLGSEAFPALEKAAQSDSREVSQRAVEILKKHFQSDDSATKQAAKASLEKLSAASGTRAGRLASEVLNPPPPADAIGLPIGPRPVIRLGGANIRGNIQVRIAAAGGNGIVKRIQVKNANGVKEIEVEENGKKVKIVDDPAKGIEMEITETKDGKPETKKYSAKNADELKQKHPEAHKIYDQHQQPNGGIRIQAGNIAPAIPGQPVPVRPAPVDDAKTREMRRAALQRTLKLIDQQIETMQRQLPDRPDVQRHIERLQAHRDRVEKMQNELGKEEPSKEEPNKDEAGKDES